MSEAFRKDPTGYLLFGLTVIFLIGVGLAAWRYRRLGKTSLFEFGPRPLVPWGGLSVLAAMILYVGLSSIGSPGKPNDVDVPVRELLWRSAAIHLGFSLLLLPLLHASSGAEAGDLGLTTRNLRRSLLRGLVACALAIPLVDLVQWFAVLVWKPHSHLVEKALLGDRSVLTAAAATLSAAIAAPIAEELLFRGVILATLWKLGASRDPEEMAAKGLREPNQWNASVDLIANAAVSMFFCSLHADYWPAPIPLFVLSMGLGEVYRRTGSIAAPIIMHASFNALSLLTLLIASRLMPLPS